MRSSGGESGCARKCVEADDSAGSGIDRNCEDTTQGNRPAAVVKVPPPERSQIMLAAEKVAHVVDGWSQSKKDYAKRIIGGTHFCGHGMMAVICPTCAISQAKSDVGGSR